ncbi:CBS domain-containing protein [Aurantivibrio plasticivorans]
MEKWHVVLLLLVGVLLLVGSLILRANFGDKYELKTIDLVLIILPLLFVLLATGKLKVLDAFGVKADFSELFADAASARIENQISIASTPDVEELVENMEMASKGGVQRIPELIKKKTEALVFRLGHGGYYGPAIKEYFDALYASSYLQYIVVLKEDGTLFSVYDVLDLAVYFRAEDRRGYQRFAKALNQKTQEDLTYLTELPGFISEQDAVSQGMTKREVLEKMDAMRVNSLPAVSDEHRFIGSVDRSQLTASMILEVTEKLQ